MCFFYGRPSISISFLFLRLDHVLSANILNAMFRLDLNLIFSFQLIA